MSLLFLENILRTMQKKLGMQTDLRDLFFRPLEEQYTSLQLSGDPLWFEKFTALPEYKSAMDCWSEEVEELPPDLRALEHARNGASKFLGPL